MENSSQQSTVEETKGTVETTKLPYSTYKEYFDDSYKVPLYYSL